MPDVLPTIYVGKVPLPPLRKKLRGNEAGANGSSCGFDGKERRKKWQGELLLGGQKNSMLLANLVKVA